MSWSNYDRGVLRQKPFWKVRAADCERLGLNEREITVERVPHPEKRAHWVYTVTCAGYQPVSDYLQDKAWKMFVRQVQSKRRYIKKVADL
jgi:hypothetical protein